VEQEAQEHGPGSTSLATAERTQCLTVCYTEVHSLVRHLAPHKNDFPAVSTTSAGAGPLARGAVEAMSTPGAPSPGGVHPKLSASRSKPAPPPAMPASAGSEMGLGDGDSIEKAVDAVEEAVGDSEADAGKSGGNGVAAAVGAVEEAVAKDVDDSDSAKPSASGHRGGVAAEGAAAAKAMGAPDDAQGRKSVEARVVTKGSSGTSGAAAGAKEGTDVRKLEDSALNDAAEAQEQVRQGESELKHLKTLLAKAHKLNKQAQDSAPTDDSGDDVSAAGDGSDAGALGDSADSAAGLGASSHSESLALKKRLLRSHH